MGFITLLFDYLCFSVIVSVTREIFFDEECHEKGHDNLELEKEVV